MIELKHLSKTLRTADGAVEALKDITLTINNGEIYGIVGMSGAGKSTLVRCINLLERPSEGQVTVNGVEMEKLSKKQLRAARRDITMIFQQFNLLEQKNCLKNVCFPLLISGIKRADAEKRARELLELVGLPDKENAYPSQLSGGQKQRVAIARALATDPKVLLCDEATSALDPNTTHSILKLIKEINQKLGITVVVITHQMSVVEEICSRVAILDGGQVAEEGEVSKIFSHPESQAAKRLVFPAEAEAIAPAPGERLFRLVYNGAESASRPFIATLAKDHGIVVNILSASTKTVEGRVYGSMIISLSSQGDVCERALLYLGRLADVSVEEI